MNRLIAHQLLNRVRDGSLRAPAWLIAQALHATGDSIRVIHVPKLLQLVAQCGANTRTERQ